MDYARVLARRWATVTVVVTGIVVYGGCALLRYDLGSTTVSFVMFAGLFGGTAWFVGHEVASYRRCPRCGTQQTGRPGDCPDCGYDVAERPRFVCTEGHAALAPGLCDCGRRLAPYQPPDVGARVWRMVWFGAGLLVVLLAVGLLLG